MRWATRVSPHIDRAACAWLIRRFIDPDAEFVFVHDPEDVPSDATPFDMRGVELGHHGTRCSFETFLESYKLDDQALQAIGRIVHEADLGDELFDAPEAAGLDVLLRGLSMIEPEDHALLTLSDRLFDGLYAYTRRATIARERI